MDLDTAMSLIIANTKTRKRNCSIIDLSEAIRAALSELSNINELADLVGISSKMLRQFIKVEHLSSDVIPFIESRKIDSVDVVNTLSLLDQEEQSEIAEAYIEKKWTSSEMRAAVEIRNKHKALSLEQIIYKVEQEKTKKEYVFECVARGEITEADIERSFMEIQIIPKNVTVLGSMVRVELVENEYAKIKELSKLRKIPQSKILPYILYKK